MENARTIYLYTMRSGKLSISERECRTEGRDGTLRAIFEGKLYAPGIVIVKKCPSVWLPHRNDKMAIQILMAYEELLLEEALDQVIKIRKNIDALKKGL